MFFEDGSVKAEDITEASIEAICFDIELRLKDVMNNPNGEEEYDEAVKSLRNADAVLDMLTGE